MSILQAKYKAHKFVNSIFYSAIFLIGFLLGFGAKYIDFSKLISNFLFIDNVEAYDIYKSSSVTIDEEYMYNYFNSNIEDFNVDDYVFGVDVESSNYYINKKALSIAKEYFSRGSYYLTWTYTNCMTQLGISCYYEFRFSPSNGNYSFGSVMSGAADLHLTNFDNLFEYNPEFTFDFSSMNKLDFSSFGDISFKDDIFKNDDNFKEVCVPVNKDFGITFADGHNYDELIPGHYTTLAFDFIWFKHGVTGLSTYFYDTQSDGHVKDVVPDNNKFLGYSFWLNSKEEINKAWNFGNIGIFLNEEALGYGNKFDYYDYTLYPFTVDFSGYKSYGGYYFSVFHFDKPGIKYIDSDKVDYPDNYCFYIRKDYDVVVFNRDEFGDSYGDINTPDGNTDVSTTENRDNYDSDRSSSTILSFLTNISDELVFVKDSVTNLYNSMPFLLRLFILSIFNILLFKIIIGMVVK